MSVYRTIGPLVLKLILFLTLKGKTTSHGSQEELLSLTRLSQHRVSQLCQVSLGEKNLKKWKCFEKDSITGT